MLTEKREIILIDSLKYFMKFTYANILNREMLKDFPLKFRMKMPALTVCV